MIFELTEAEELHIQKILAGWADTPKARLMKKYIQHGKITTYDHCIQVAKVSLWLNRRWHLNANESNLIRGAFLHDFFLYDWHDPKSHTRLHGFYHPQVACENAEKNYQLNDTIRDIIRCHMWPLTIRSFPRTREGMIVVIADKICSTNETLLHR